MDRRGFLVGGAAAAFTAGCGGLFKRDEPQPPQTRGERAEGGARKSAGAATLLFGIGVHVEPLGATGGESGGGPRGKGPDYTIPEFYSRHVRDLMTLADVVEAHGGRLTIQLQRPFSAVAAKNGDERIRALVERGHEVAQHFHENVWLGQNCEGLPVEKWAEAIREQKEEIEGLTGRKVRYLSGGNLYPGLPEALKRVGIPFNGDYKNPREQSQPQELSSVNPWRPSAGATAKDISSFARHDPAGALVFLPEGIFSSQQFQATSAQNRESNDAWYTQAAERIPASLKAADPGRVNVAHLTVHPGEFTGVKPGQGPPKDPYSAFDRFLTDNLDPLLKAGQVRWATFSQMGDAWLEWEGGPGKGMEARPG